ncbi:Membrane protein implicated in regulation of membrane protease activity [Actinacidiphila yanglinensis]|uniref:Membrane protein implicated in regulation of membrane protease activity n=1 Tax=Actinacidiphila yanglinensis TaxID=310779 RepID=A0A1H5U5Y3_9ACTN|nr:Membrane protein implicated in regulation of membrane protease activity [Actinacidiphila yanglinensis]
MWWLVAAAGLGIPLVITAMPEFGMFAVGAIGGAVTAGLGGGIVVQVVVFVLVSVALLVFVRPLAYRNRQRPDQRSGVEALKGKQAVVLERVDGGAGGRIKLAGEIWSARSLEHDRVFDPGQHVDVVEIDGATAVVM